jgi:hypothetical protein
MATYYEDVISADSPSLVAAGIITGIGGPAGVSWLPSTPGTTGTAPTADTGDYGYQLDGATAYGQTPYEGSPTGGLGPFSVELWVMPNGYAGTLVGSGAPGGTAPDFTLQIESGGAAGGRVAISLGAGDVNYALFYLHSNPGLCRTGVWNHVVVTFDGVATVYIYVNGVGISGTLSLPFGFYPASQAPLLIGAMGEPLVLVSGILYEIPTDFFGGGISNVAFYDFPLSQQQVCRHLSAVNGTAVYPDISTYIDDYYPTIITDNPTAYYRCDETAGNLAVDRSGNGNNGAYGLGEKSLDVSGAIYDGNPAVLLEEPPLAGNAWDATPAGIVTPLRSISFDTEFSIEAWVYLTSVPPSGYTSQIASVCGGNELAGDGAGIQFYVDDAGYAHIFLQGGSIASNVQSAAPLPSGQYNYVCATWDLTTLSLYVNGVLSASATPTGTFSAWSYNLCFGFNPASDAGDIGQLAASLDEPAIYAYALTAGRVYIHWKAGLGPLEPPPPPVAIGNDQHYFLLYIYDKKGNLVDIPQADIDSLNLMDQLNGGSGTSDLSFVRDFNQIGAINYLYRVHAYMWNGRIPQPTNPTWAGYMVDIDQEKTRTLGKITVHLEGDQKQLDRGAVYENVNPLVGGNPALDAADYMRHLYTVYAPPGYCILACPPTLFPLLPGQYQMMQLGEVIDTVLKTGRDDLGNLITWRVWNNSALVRTLQIRPDQNPNTVEGVQFKHIFMEMCASYKINTKYSEMCNVITILGGQDYITGLPVVGSYIDDESEVAFGPWEQILSVWQLISQSAADSYAEAFLDIHGNPQANGEIELHAPDPSLVSGVWIQVWEKVDPISGPVIKQMRISSVRWEVGRSRIKQTLSPTAPTPYLDYAVYKMGLTQAKRGNNQISNLPVNLQNNFVRGGGNAS